jgi:hypothetical protein
MVGATTRVAGYGQPSPTQGDTWRMAALCQLASSEPNALPADLCAPGSRASPNARSRFRLDVRAGFGPSPTVLAAQVRQAQQCLVLRGTIVLRYQDRGAPIALRMAADIAHDAIDDDGITPFVKPLDHDIALMGHLEDRCLQCREFTPLCRLAFDRRMLGPPFLHIHQPTQLVTTA